MKKFIALILAAIILLTLSGCGSTVNYDTPDINDYEEYEEYHTWTEELDLSLVERYEIDIYSYGKVSIEDASKVQRLNEFLGNVVTVHHSNEPCNCEYDVWVDMYLTTGERIWFGVEENRDNGSFNFSRNSASIISFRDKSYDEFINLVKSL